MSLKDHIAGPVKFNRLEAGELWYVCEDGFQFPVPLTDTYGAVFNAEDKGMFFMRWIRKHMEQVQQYEDMLKAATE
jgi:hypothetical protein